MDDNKEVSIKRKKNDSNENNMRKTIGLRTHTKDKLNQNRAPGQCYDGFICQLIDLWERTKSSNGGGAYRK